jgi:hypothetical protein
VADPSEDGRDAPYEWIEVQNRSSTPVDLRGWQAGDSKSLASIEENVVVLPGAYALIAGRLAFAEPPAGVAVARLASGEIGSGLNNDEDVVRLVRPDGSEADVLAYGPSSEVAAAGPGESLAFDDEAGEWITGARPSPGAPFGRTEPGSSTPQAIVRVPSIPISEGGDGESRIPWIILGVCVAVGVFTAPFAFQRARRTFAGWREHAR